MLPNAETTRLTYRLVVLLTHGWCVWMRGRMCLENSPGGGQYSASAESNKFMEMDSENVEAYVVSPPLDVSWIWRVGPGI